MIRIINRLIELPSHWFVRSAVILQAGSFAGNIIQAVAGIFIARILQPEMFGVFALAMGLSSFVSALAGIGVQDAVATRMADSYARKDRQGIADGAAFLLKAVVLIFLILAVLSLVLPSVALRLYGNSEIGKLAMIIVVGAGISTSFFSLANIALQITGRMIPMTMLMLGDQITRVGLSPYLVYMGLGVLGASVGHLVGAVLILPISIALWRSISLSNSIFPPIRDIILNIRRVALKKYSSFALWVTADRNIAILYGTLPVLLVGVYSTTQEVTYFKLAFGYINLALSLLGPISVLLSIEFPKMKVDSSERLFRNFIRVTFYSVGLSTLLTAGAIIVAPWAFNILYGPNFSSSVPYARGLILYGALFGFGVGLGPMWRAINKVGVSILINLIILGLGIPMSMLMMKGWGAWGGVAMVTALYTISHLTSFIYLAKKLRPLNVAA